MFEINLVPDIKAEMIRAQRIRNFVFFLAFVVAAAAVGAVFFLMAIKAGQDIRMSGQDKTLNEMSDVLAQYDGLDELLTIQNQLNKLEEIGNNKKVLSRVFNILDTILPDGSGNGDIITVSTLNVDLDNSLLSFEAQALAGEEKNNFRVLDAFSKSISLMKYDYGRYVDEQGNVIPTKCIREAEDGKIFIENDAVYAWWDVNADGCDPAKPATTTTTTSEGTETEGTSNNESSNYVHSTDGYEVNDRGEIKIYRTPLTDTWYEMTKSNSNSETTKGMMLDGTITGIPHFESECITYEGTEVTGSKPKWISTNQCLMADTESGDTEPGISVSDSSDAVQSDGERVLRFNGIVYVNSEVFKFNNKHMLVIAPSGNINVTDSFTQIGSMFAERAKDIEGEK